jgi:hypothetical protein
LIAESTTPFEAHKTSREYIRRSQQRVPLCIFAERQLTP